MKADRISDPSLLLLDDHVILRSGLRLLLERESDLSVAAEASSLKEALDLALEPDVIIADLMLPDGRGAAVVSRLRERFRAARVLVLTMVDHSQEIEACLGAGASGYLLKSAAGDELIVAVRAVARGEEYLQPALGAALARWRAGPQRMAGRSSEELTKRETEVLRLITLGHTNKEIAAALVVSLRTIESHRAAIMRKIGAKTRSDLVGYAAEHGLIEPGDR